MPLIQPKISWPHKGHNYDTEIEAVQAAIEEMGKRLIREHSANPGKGLTENRELARYLTRYHELCQPEEVTSPELAEGTHSEELEGTQDLDQRSDEDEAETLDMGEDA